MTYDIVPIDSHRQYFHEAVRIYTIVWDRNEQESTIFFQKYLRFPHYLGYVAKVGNHVVGMAFGTASECGQWWHDKVADHVGRTHPDIQDAWVLTELAVLSEFRGQGIGAALLDAVIQTQPCRNLLLSTPIDNYDARRFYERHGWDYLHRGFAFQKGHTPYVIMHRYKPSPKLATSEHPSV